MALGEDIPQCSSTHSLPHRLQWRVESLPSWGKGLGVGDGVRAIVTQQDSIRWGLGLAGHLDKEAREGQPA